MSVWGNIFAWLPFSLMEQGKLKLLRWRKLGISGIEKRANILASTNRRRENSLYVRKALGSTFHGCSGIWDVIVGRSMGNKKSSAGQWCSEWEKFQLVWIREKKRKGKRTVKHSQLDSPDVSVYSFSRKRKGVTPSVPEKWTSLPLLLRGGHRSSIAQAG
jgi:hypothetical protein